MTAPDADPIVPASPLAPADRFLEGSGAERGAGSAGAYPEAGASGTAGRVLAYPLRFDGDAREYFRIWIVNTALTIVTLGLYAPWARVRNRQYFYQHTWLDGQNFSYTANPFALLRGYLLVGGLFTLFNLSLQYGNSTFQGLSLALLLVFIGFYPWLVRQSMRFLARSTVHRGLNFQFLGTVGGAYLAYGLGNLAAGIAGGLALPWAWFLQRSYQADGLAYGGAQGRFRGEVGRFYVIGLLGFALTVAGTLFVLFPLIFLVVSLSGGGDIGAGEALVPILGGVAAVSLLYLISGTYVRMATMHYVLNHFELGGVLRLRASFSPWQLVWIALSNAVVRLLTLGLMTPWAAIRYNRAVLEQIQVLTIGDLDEFKAGAVKQESALGEAATELLDINIGF